MRDVVAYESRLELAWLLLFDQDPSVIEIYAQPLHLSAVIDNMLRRHVPDFLFVQHDGRVVVVDVKPSSFLDDAAVSRTFGWTSAVMLERGWDFQVCTEPDAVVLANIRFLAGYRRRELFDQRVLTAITQAVAEDAMTILGVQARLAPWWPAHQVRPHLLHLLWTGRLGTDLQRPLGGCSRLRLGS